MADDLRARWETWARRHLGPDERGIQAATDAAVRAARHGATSKEAAEAARSVARSFRDEQPPAATGPSTARDEHADPPRTPGALVGEARHVQQRTQLFEGQSLVFLTFRVARRDGSAVSVEMHGLILTGTVAEGDVVEVPAGKPDRGVVVTDRLFNRTTGSEVRTSRGVPGTWAVMKASQGRRWSMVQLGCGLFVLALFAAAVVAFFVWVLPSMGSSPDSPGSPTSVTVPDVVGKDNVGAARTISDAELRPASESENSADVPFGRVIRQSPEAGTSVPSGTTVTFVISTGPPF